MCHAACLTQVMVNRHGALLPGRHTARVTRTTSTLRGNKAEYMLRLTAALKTAHAGLQVCRCGTWLTAT